MADEPIAVVSRPVGGQEWDWVVCGFDGICQEQLHSFASVRWPGVTLEPRLFENNGRVVGGALMMVQVLPLGLGKVAIAKWAPMLADLRHPQAAALYDGMVDALVAEYADQRGMMISVVAHASPEQINPEYLALTARGFRPGISLPYPDRYLVRLGLSDDDQRRSLGQTWRRQLNKSEKAGLRFEHGRPGMLEDFKVLYAAMTERKQFPDHSAYETLDRLMDLEEPLRPELFFVYHGETLVAGALIFKAGDRAVYLYGATNEQALPLRAGYFMHWNIIRWLRDNTKASWYDLGGTDGYSGLHQFKKGMVGEAGTIRALPPALNYASRPMAYIMGTGALLAREALLELRRWIDARRPTGAKPDMPRPRLGRSMQ
ncbi:MAG: GNAT family N-acetyltransferase [Phyllobacteriaceae bacterium]|nr:GNAT family N-acetyltransferase [Phyllobacteriaceae bacterium]